MVVEEDVVSFFRNLEKEDIDVSCMQSIIEMQADRKLLKEHKNKIWQGSNGLWYTYVPDSKKGRRLIKRNSREKIEKDIIADKKEKILNPTVSEVYQEWADKKVKRGEIQQNTKERYDRQFNQCFIEFGDRKIKSVDENDIEDFVLDTIPRCKLTAKGYSNMRTLLYGIFRLAKKKHYINYSITNTIADIDVSQKSFRKVKYKDNELVFMEDELPKVYAELESDLDMVNLGLLLLFKTGLRIGELAALRPSDINGCVISINATEISFQKGDGTYVYTTREFPKTEAGIREVVIKDEDLWIIKRIKLLNPSGKFLFERNCIRLCTYNFRNRLRTICRHANIKLKSPNKIRKTYGTVLIDSGVNESVVISQMGHTNIKTTKNHYYRNRKNITGKKEELKKVVSL